MEDLKQKYLSMLYGNKKLYKKHELQVVDNLIDTHRKYNKENLFTESQVLEYGENCFEAGFAKCDIVEAGLEAKETDVNYPLPEGEGASGVNTPTNVGSSS